MSNKNFKNQNRRNYNQYANKEETTPVEEIEPQKDEMLDIIYKASEVDKKGYFTYMSYRDVCQKVKDSEKVDILRLERHKALAIFKPQIGKYVDAYVEVTVSNDTRLNIFYNVYNAKTNDVIYTYRKLAPKDSTRDALLYSELTKDFYRDFLDAIEKVRKDKEKEAKAIIKDDKVKVKDAEKTTD